MGNNQAGRMHTAGFHTGFFAGGGKQSVIGNTVCEVQCPRGVWGYALPGNSLEI